MKTTKFLIHIIALLTVIVWGITFVSTKVLIQNGLTPISIFIIRFGLAYLCAIAFAHNKLFANKLKDEIYFIFAGITGGSLYFIAENSALGLTFASNVSLIICCAPIFTMFLGKAIFNDKISKMAWLGTCIAFLGVGIVVFNGTLYFKLKPLGDILTLVAAISWALYCLLLKKLNQSYSNMFINRKVFFYGLLTASIWVIITGSFSLNFNILKEPIILSNLLFLGVGASFLCYLMWNRAVKIIGVERTANYIYLVPLITIFTSFLFIQEPITLIMLFGAIFIISGVFLSTK